MMTDSHIQADYKFYEVWGSLLSEIAPGWEAKLVQPAAPYNHAPSREFLVRQSVLNALAQHMPASTRLDGAPSAMRHLVALCGWEHGQPSRWFVQSVRDHFAVLVAQYA